MQQGHQEGGECVPPFDALGRLPFRWLLFLLGYLKRFRHQAPAADSALA
jgi:hypothetical protein